MDLITLEGKDLASKELQEQRKKLEEDNFNSRRSDWNNIHATQNVGMYTCENCKGSRTSSYAIQIRGADEPMTMYFLILTFFLVLFVVWIVILNGS